MSNRSIRAALGLATLVTVAGFALALPADAQSVRKECSTKYQAAKTANTLNGMSWNQFYSQCSAEAKAGGTAPAAAPAATPVAAPAPAAPPPAAKPTTTAAAPTAPAAVPAKPVAAAPAATAAPGATKPMSAGRAAFVARERQCGTEWRANKVALVAATPGLTWPKYLSSCNARLKAAGQ